MLSPNAQGHVTPIKTNNKTASTCIATVTYGNRKHLLTQMIEGGHEQGVTRFVVVNNGAQWDVNELKNIFPELDIEIVDMGGNTGSAGGFAAAIQRAYDLGAEFIWLLDDDNKTQEHCLQALLEAYEREEATTPRDRLAVLAFRPEHQADVAAGVPIKRINARRDSFCGFHVYDIPYKIWRRTPWGHPRGPVAEKVCLDVAPYSGLLFRRELVSAIGLPDARLVLYADDTEYTWRITARGGKIFLVTAARLDDLESSWNIKKRFSNSLIGWLTGSGDYRAYYGMRNQAYFDSHFRRRFAPLFALNRFIYLGLLHMYAHRLRLMSRYKLLKSASADGLAGRLGVHPEYRL